MRSIRLEPPQWEDNRRHHSGLGGYCTVGGRPSDGTPPAALLRTAESGTRGKLVNWWSQWLGGVQCQLPACNKLHAHQTFS